jgi:hypothetical protein
MAYLNFLQGFELSDPDLHCFWKLDPGPDPHQGKRLDPDLH